MSNPGSPVIPQINVNSVQSKASSTTSSVSENHISYKKPVKIKNELNEKRRNALKEYYKLKKQQKELEEKQNVGRRGSNKNDDEDSDAEDVIEGQPVADIDLINIEFKDLVKDTNKLTSSINLINSSIKNIIYNNYYELIKLNDFLKDLNELDLSKLIIEEHDEKNKKSDAINLLNDAPLQSATSVRSLKLDSFEGDGFAKLKSLMNEIDELDKDEVSEKTSRIQEDNVDSSITSYLQIKNKDDLNEDVREDIKKTLDDLIGKLKTEKDKETLLRQLVDIQRKLN